MLLTVTQLSSPPPPSCRDKEASDEDASWSVPAPGEALSATHTRIPQNKVTQAFSPSTWSAPPKPQTLTIDMVMVCKNIFRLLRSYAARCDAALVLSSPLRFSTAAIARKPPPVTPLIARFLIDSCGFSPDTAARASRALTHIKSTSNPEKVIQFLKNRGLDDAHIRDLIRTHPRILCADVETTLEPRVEALQQLGFSDSEIAQLVVIFPFVLRYTNLQPKIEFWRTLYGGNNDNLLRAIRRNVYLLTCSMDKRIVPNVALLRSYGLSDDQIAKLEVRSLRLITRTTKSIEVLVQRAKELGIPPGSGMFHTAISCVSSISQSKIEAKIKILRSLGGSEAEIKSGIKRCPSLVKLSDKKIIDNMNFLLHKVGCEPAYVFRRLGIISYSLEKRLIPRHYVLQALKSRGIGNGWTGLFSMISKTDKWFISRIILPHKERVPELHESYIAACAGNVAIQSKN